MVKETDRKEPLLVVSGGEVVENGQELALFDRLHQWLKECPSVAVGGTFSEAGGVFASIQVVTIAPSQGIYEVEELNRFLHAHIRLPIDQALGVSARDYWDATVGSFGKGLQYGSIIYDEVVGEQEITHTCGLTLRKASALSRLNLDRSYHDIRSLKERTFLRVVPDLYVAAFIVHLKKGLRNESIDRISAGLNYVDYWLNQDQLDALRERRGFGQPVALLAG